jgi:hypothetical protein
MKSNPAFSTLRNIFLVQASLCGAIFSGPVLRAQSRIDPAKPAGAEAREIVALGTLTVTGSNIRRVEAETALPITVFNQADITLRGGSTGADLFGTLTFAAPPQVNETIIASQGARGDVSLVTLRLCRPRPPPARLPRACGR